MVLNWVVKDEKAQFPEAVDEDQDNSHKLEAPINKRETGWFYGKMQDAPESKYECQI